MSINDEADAWLDKWTRALPKYGKDQKYWDKVLEIAGRFIDKHGKTGRVAIVNRLEVLELRWSDLNGKK